jgi:hypothetical protein
MRNPNPFTIRQIHLLEAIREKIRQINDSDAEVVVIESLEWRTEQTRQFGKIPKIRFKPYSSQIKAEILRQAKLIDEAKEKEIVQIRQKYGVRAAKNKEARLFESEWNNIMFKIKKATFTVGFLNQLFSDPNQKVSEPIRIMQHIVMDEFSPLINAKREPMGPYDVSKPAETLKNKGLKPYDQKIDELE